MNIRRRPPNPRIKVANLEYGIPHSESKPKNILEEIIWEKEREVELSRKRVPLDDLKSQISSLPHTLGFLDSLKESKIKPSVIAEVKKASPSKGVIRQDFDPLEISLGYKQGGASCVSVLTEKSFFQGGFDVLVKVRKTVDLPILCKDFIFTPYQLFQARAAGADAALLIAAVLSDQDLSYLAKVSEGLGLDVLLEVHDSQELERVLKLEMFPLIGINNRDLASFKTDLACTESLLAEFREELTRQGVTIVSESGLFNRKDLDRVSSAGADAVLIGESLMKQKDVKAALEKLIHE